MSISIFVWKLHNCQKPVIQSQIETKLAKEIIKGTVHQGQHVEVDYQDGFVLKAQ